MTIIDLGDVYMLTRDDLAEAWVAVNARNGSPLSTIEVAINGGAAASGTLMQPGKGKAKLTGVEYAAPSALARQ